MEYKRRCRECKPRGATRTHGEMMTSKSAAKGKLTDAERHRRFVEMAREVEASESSTAFDKAFKRVARAKVPKKPSRKNPDC